MSAHVKDPPGARQREIFLGALEKPDAVERAAFLAAACGGDVGLRRRVEELLREEAGIGSFLETPAAAPPVGPGGTACFARVTEKPGDRIGRYKLLQKIGEGGCGVVYMAEQEEHVRRRVALKVIKLGMDTKSVIARFEAERQALAMMEHSNIAKVFDAGATETGRPFFVMELVRGIKITEYCDQNKLPPAERLQLFIEVCQAIQHAHQKGIIHRDIKPSNILVTLHDGTPVPKVIDFGIAKAIEQRLTDKTLFTEFAAFVGTPAYTSPEQAEMSGLDIDTRSDIYSLGVLLYELLTGETPFDAEALMQSGLDECRRTIREKEPARPSTRLATMLEAELTATAQQRRTEAVKLIHLLSGDLDWIVMKCLEKDRTRRYATANALAMDVERYLHAEPVLARPPSNIYRLKKLVRRHRGAFAAAVTIAVTLVAGAGLSTWQAVRARQAERRAQRSQQQETQLRQQAEQDREQAEKEKAVARLNEYIADVNLAQQSLAAGNYGRAVQLLDKHRPAAGEPDLRGFEWRYLWQVSRGDDHEALPDQGESVQSVAYSPGGSVAAVALPDKLNVWNLRTKALVTSLSWGVGPMPFGPPRRGATNRLAGFLPPGAVSLAFAPDGQSLISASRGTVRVWRTSDWSEITCLPECSGPVALSRAGSRLATIKGNPRRRDGVSVLDTAAWKELRLLPGASGPLAFSPDGKTLATDSEAGITLWPLDDAGGEVVLQDSTNVFVRAGPGPGFDRTLAFSPDGRFVVAARNTLSGRGVFVLSLWDAKTGQEIAVMPGDPAHVEHTGVIASLAFSPDGRTLATASMDHSIRLWAFADFAQRQRPVTLQGQLSEVWTLAFSPDGQTLLSGAKDGAVWLWPTRQRQKADLLPGAQVPLAFSADGRTLVALNGPDAVVFFNLATGEPERQIQLERARFAFPPPLGPAPSLSEDLKTLAQGLGDGRVKIWNTDTGESRTLKAGDSGDDFGRPDRRGELVALSPDGHTLITAGGGRTSRWWDLRSGTNVVVGMEAFRLWFSPDSRTLAASGPGATVELWDVATRSLRTNLVVDSQPGFGATFSPDGRILATTAGMVDNVIRLWATATGELLGTCAGHKQGVRAVAFSPDGKTLASASDDSTLKLWNLATQQELLTIRRLGGSMSALLFSPDGRLLVGGSGVPPRDGKLVFYAAPDFAVTDGREPKAPAR